MLQRRDQIPLPRNGFLQLYGPLRLPPAEGDKLLIGQTRIGERRNRWAHISY